MSGVGMYNLVAGGSFLNTVRGDDMVRFFTTGSHRCMMRQVQRITGGLEGHLVIADPPTMQATKCYTHRYPTPCLVSHASPH